MCLIEIRTLIKSDIKTCFDLARNIDFYQEHLSSSKEKAIAGKISGLIGLGEWVSWEAEHFGFVQHLTSKITGFESPNYFVDEMVFGAFKSLRHEHYFQEEIKGLTVMTDKFYFESHFGLFGKFANWLFLKKYITNLLIKRHSVLKEKAESL